MRALCIVNRTAGGGRASRAWDAIAGTMARMKADVAFTTHAGHAADLARQACADGFTHLLAVGGDGTVHEVVNGIQGPDVALGLVPCGTGNDFARSAGFPFQPQAAVAGLDRDRRRAVDLGVCNGHRFLNVAGAGFDAEVARLINEGPRRSRGALPYVATAISLAFRYRAEEFRLDLDGTTLVQPCLLAAVGNASAYGGGMRICPRAELDDGLLDVCVVAGIPTAHILSLLPRVFLGRHVSDRSVSYHRARTVEILGPAGVAVHADGEVIGGLPARFSVAASACSLWLPAA
ncbi:MAG TPA: diacylglycerol kinase family protein [Bacillota bacterium]|nr:diacylglycerol kinase family protein [Bacillota bacterium]